MGGLLHRLRSNMIYLRRYVNLIMHCQTCEKGRGGRLNENSQSEQNVETLGPSTEVLG
jgi:hypothetical protein